MTPEELSALRDKLKEAEALAAAVRDAFVRDGRTGGARLLGEVVLALQDELAELDKELAAQ